MRFRFVVSTLAAAFVLAGCAAPAPRAESVGAAAPADPSAYNGRWRADAKTNEKLAEAARKRTGQGRGGRPSGGPPGGGPGGMGGMGPGGGMGGGPGMGMPPGGGPGGPGGGPPGMGGGSEDAMPAIGALREDMDFAAPLNGDLRIRYAPEGVELGEAGKPGVLLMFDRGDWDIGDGLRARAELRDGALVVAMTPRDGPKVTLTYLLEPGGTRLWIKTRVEGGGPGGPGARRPPGGRDAKRGDGPEGGDRPPAGDGFESERVFDRIVPNEAKPASE